MSDTNDTDQQTGAPRKPLSVRGGSGQGSAKTGFRGNNRTSKVVVVEKKRRRSVGAKDKAATTSDPKK